MSQRGGSVITYVRMSKKVYSPIIENGMADFILAFEELEALRWVSLLKEDKKIIVNQQKILPATVLTGSAEYPTEINEKLKALGVKKENLIAIPAYEMALKAGNVRAVNMVMIGVMSKFTDIPKEIWINSILENFTQKLQKINIEAFEDGRNFI